MALLFRFWESSDNSWQAHTMNQNMPTLSSSFIVPHITWKSPLKKLKCTGQYQLKQYTTLLLEGINLSDWVTFWQSRLLSGLAVCNLSSQSSSDMLRWMFPSRHTGRTCTGCEDDRQTPGRREGPCKIVRQYVASSFSGFRWPWCDYCPLLPEGKSKLVTAYMHVQNTCQQVRHARVPC